MTDDGPRPTTAQAILALLILTAGVILTGIQIAIFIRGL